MLSSKIDVKKLLPNTSTIYYTQFSQFSNACFVQIDCGVIDNLKERVVNTIIKQYTSYNGTLRKHTYLGLSEIYRYTYEYKKLLNDNLRALGIHINKTFGVSVSITLSEIILDSTHSRYDIIIANIN